MKYKLVSIWEWTFSTTVENSCFSVTSSDNWDCICFCIHSKKESAVFTIPRIRFKKKQNSRILPFFSPLLPIISRNVFPMFRVSPHLGERKKTSWGTKKKKDKVRTDLSLRESRARLSFPEAVHAGFHERFLQGDGKHRPGPELTEEKTRKKNISVYGRKKVKINLLSERMRSFEGNKTKYLFNLSPIYLHHSYERFTL